ncbi:hypothetical protein EJ06DRAFT_271849 [Trichodelitschia bisporula]|uniref:Diaminohydroxyphosphoribosylamino-pyrimidine deaminase n=1 Tax=Trichodelitschia bisporula TaxID=703511 RepID=A0A6G1I540_9PEZI|nr:hypothetical protein EJ06DRAFT_271849 [Trichodelitschia bisporula]
MDRLSACLGPQITDPDEEAFVVFAQDLPSHNLGFVDAKATDVELTVGGRDLVIHQSPGLLTSSRKEGTTGAVVWQVTPRVAQWLSVESNFLFASGLLDSTSHVLELGCGVAGVVALVLAPQVASYIATDQEYVLKHLRQNIADNAGRGKGKRANITVRPLDWETSSVAALYTDLGLVDEGIGAIVCCDCIYNESLIAPLVDTCVDICHLAPAEKPTVCIFAQQLRSFDVFEAWLAAFHAAFETWRVPDSLLTADLKEGSGFVVHIGMLRSQT